MPTRRSQGDGSLYRAANGLWRAAVTLPSVDGKRRRKVVSSAHKTVAMAKLRTLRKEVAEGRATVTGSTTVGRWLRKWIDEIHGPSLRPKAYTDYESIIRLHITPAIGHKRLDVLTAEDVRAMYREMQRTSTRTAAQSHIILRKALGDAMKEGILGKNITDAVAKPKHTPTPPEPLDADQCKALLRSCIDAEDPLAPLWATAFLTAPRPGELLGIELDRTDLDHGIFELSWQLQQLNRQRHGCGDGTPDGWPCGKIRAAACPKRRWDMPPGFEFRPLYRSLVLTRPKTKTGTRIVPIPAPLWAMLNVHIENMVGPNPHNLLWHHPDGRPISPREHHTLWKAALDRAGLPDAPPYVSRHTTATLLSQSDVPEEIRMQIMGQSSVVAHRGYTHIDQTQTRKALANLDHLLLA